MTERALAATLYPCSGPQALDVPLVLIHGWGNDSRVWHGVLPLLRERLDVIALDLPGFAASPSCRDWPTAVEMICAALPERCVLLGWSLGGMLAVRAAAQAPQKVEKLITLAASPLFVARDGWADAMAGDVFEGFRSRFAADPHTCLQHFCGLQSRGDRNERAVLRWLRNNGATVRHQPWLAALDWLGQLDNRALLPELATPSLHLFGGRDQLVPVAAAAALRALCPGAQVEVLDDVGHAPQISESETLARRCLAFIDAEPAALDPYGLDKREVAASFSRAAASYDGAAHLQRAVGEKLLGMVPEDMQPRHVVDMGCGTGHFTRLLARRYPQAACAGLDLAPGMVAYAAAGAPHITWLCGDAEAVPLGDGSVDLVFSNFTYQWCRNLETLMAEQYRVLAPGGALVFTTVGPRTLWELREAWRQVDSHVHVNRFAEAETVRAALRDAGFAVTTWDVETRVVHYPQLADLTRELKALGAHNLNRGRNNALTSRKQIAALKAGYEALRDAHGLPASWEVFYVVARK